MAKIYLIEGSVGSGKSTFGQELSKKVLAPFFSLDDWFKSLYSPDRPSTEFVQWYNTRKERCIKLILKTSEELLKADSDVILELGLILRVDREIVFKFIDEKNYDLKMYVIDANKETRRNRVLKRNVEKGETYSMEVPEQIFETADYMWQPLEDDETAGRNIEYIFN
jgi:predicted kinase